nr:MAG TPA: hypothetical protein [Caudoviricetes sp.]
MVQYNQKPNRFQHQQTERKKHYETDRLLHDRNLQV